MNPGDFVLPFGKHKGRTFDRVAEDDEGLLYLDWLVGQNWLMTGLKLKLKAYLSQPAIAAGLDGLISRRQTDE